MSHLTRATSKPPSRLKPSPSCFTYSIALPHLTHPHRFQRSQQKARRHFHSTLYTHADTRTPRTDTRRDENIPDRSPLARYEANRRATQPSTYPSDSTAASADRTTPSIRSARPDIPYESHTQESSTWPSETETPVRATTMTSYERQAFSALFDSLLDDRKDKIRKTRPSDTVPATAQADGSDAVASPDGSRDVDALLAELPYNRSSTTTTTPSPADKGVSSFPAQLQTQATLTHTEFVRRQAQRQRQVQPQDVTAGPSHQDVDTDLETGTDIKTAIANAAEPLKGILQSLDAARSDVDVWRIVRDELFARLDALHAKVRADTRALEEAGSGSKKSGKKSKKKNKQTATPHIQPQEIPTQKEAPPPLPLQSYRTLPLHTHHLLRTRFPTSPLTRTLLPHLKNHSPTSYFLTTTVALYNAHILHLITRCHSTPTTSIPAILSLLSEMQNSGLTPDRGTHDALDVVTRFHSVARRGVLGEGVRALEGVPGRSAEVRGVRGGKGTVLAGLEEAEMVRARRVGVEREMRAQGAISGIEGEEEGRDEAVAVAAGG